jgi:hypothetical protein
MPHLADLSVTAGALRPAHDGHPRSVGCLSAIGMRSPFAVLERLSCLVLSSPVVPSLRMRRVRICNQVPKLTATTWRGPESCCARLAGKTFLGAQHALRARFRAALRAPFWATLDG